MYIYYNNLNITTDGHKKYLNFDKAKNLLAI
jgi:hypothetical protein